MVRRCCVKDCKSEWWPGTEMSFHSFPKNDEMKRRWIDAIPDSEERNINWKHAAICSKHFEEDCYVETHNFALRNNLKRDAVPTLFGDDTVPEYIDLEVLSDVSNDSTHDDPPEDPMRIFTKDAAVQTVPEKRTIHELEEEYKKREMDLRKRLKRAEDKIQQMKALINAPDKRNEMDVLEEAIQKYVPEDRRDIIWNELSQHASPAIKKNYDYDMKDFAMTIYLFSPEAYDYLRGKMSLPHPATLRKWLR